MRRSAAQYCAALRSTAQCRAVPRSTAQYCAACSSAVPRSTARSVNAALDATNRCCLFSFIAICIIVRIFKKYPKEMWNKPDIGLLSFFH